MTDELPKGFTCECGDYHEFSTYVYAHWDEPITHTCDCERRHRILNGRVKLVNGDKVTT